MRPNLVLSSSIMLTASIMAFLHNRPVLAVVSAVTTLASSCYWFYQSELFYYIDKFVAQSAFCIYTIYGMYYISGVANMTIGWTLWILTLTMYIISVKLYELKSPTWEIFHATFHSVAATSQSFIASL